MSPLYTFSTLTGLLVIDSDNFNDIFPPTCLIVPSIGSNFIKSLTDSDLFNTNFVLTSLNFKTIFSMPFISVIFSFFFERFSELANNQLAAVSHYIA